MQRATPPDAVFFLAELPAQGAMLWCMSHGVRVPEDVAIAGFGDLSISYLLPVPMTTVRIRGHAIGTHSAKLAHTRLSGGSMNQTVHDIGYSLQIREST